MGRPLRIDGRYLLFEGRYRLVEKLGTGGMSVVWRGYDETLGREVAVKVLSPDLAGNRAFRDRLRQEALAAARLCHPHITGIHDFGESPIPGGRTVPYVVMELNDGESLGDRIGREGALRWREAVAVAAEVAAALATAHARGVVHRDVTPANVMLTGVGAKVVDFGISALVGQRDAAPDGSLLGTPAYLAPERLAGAEVSPATDVYSLGLLLYRALTGRMPWPAQSTTQALRAHLYADPEPLPDLPGLPAVVADLCLRCLAKDPGERPAAAEVAHGLAATVGLQPIIPPVRRRATVARGVVPASAVRAVGPGGAGPGGHPLLDRFASGWWPGLDRLRSGALSPGRPFRDRLRSGPLFHDRLRPGSPFRDRAWLGPLFRDRLSSGGSYPPGGRASDRVWSGGPGLGRLPFGAPGSGRFSFGALVSGRFMLGGRLAGARARTAAIVLTATVVTLAAAGAWSEHRETGEEPGTQNVAAGRVPAAGPGPAAGPVPAVGTAARDVVRCAVRYQVQRDSGAEFAARITVVTSEPGPWRLEFSYPGSQRLARLPAEVTQLGPRVVVQGRGKERAVTLHGGYRSRNPLPLAFALNRNPCRAEVLGSTNRDTESVRATATGRDREPRQPRRTEPAAAPPRKRDKPAAPPVGDRAEPAPKRTGGFSLAAG